jgi:hypothetical protein
MLARWTSLAIGLWLIFSPLLLGYQTVAPIVHDVLLGLLASVSALAALERPALRFTAGLPGLWLVLAPSIFAWQDRQASLTELASGFALLALAWVPGGNPKLASQRHAARMTA